MEATLDYTEYTPKTKLDFARFHADLSKNANENLVAIVQSVLNEKRLALLKSVPGEMTNPLVGHRDVNVTN
jgi:hypothetical protein